MKRPLRRLLRLLLGLILLAGLALGVVGWFGSSHLLSPPRRGLQDYHRTILARPAEHGLAIEAWSAPGGSRALVVHPAAHPGAALKSRELRQRVPSAPRWGEIVGTVVLLHGHQGRKEDHLPICERFCAAGFRCVLVDLPGHGDHPEPFATFGHREAPWLAEIRDAFSEDHPFYLFGVSQGGAIALQAAALAPERWQGVISVAAFATLDEAVDASTRDFHPALRPLGPLLAGSVSLATRMRAGFSPSGIRPVDAVRSLDLPVLLIHGDADRFIPLDHARRLHRELPGRAKTLRVVRDAGHGRVLAADAARTYAACCEFLLRHAR